MNEKNEWFKLNKCGRIFLYWYLGILLMISLILVVLDILFRDELINLLGIDKVATISCIIFPLFGSCIFYIRKLYKACINLDIVEPKSSEDDIRQSGIIFYFILRPIFSIGFGIILFLSLKIGISAIVKSPEINDGFIYTCSFFSFFIGYSAGDVIDKFEKVGKEIVTSIFESNTKKN